MKEVTNDFKVLVIKKAFPYHYPISNRNLSLTSLQIMYK